jgi:ribose 5-phosphate isomerase A
VVIADAAKHVKVLGKFPLPIEVVPSATSPHRAAPATPRPSSTCRRRAAHGRRASCVTDGGNLIYDAACGRIEEPAALAEALKAVTGVVDHGLFLDLADLKRCWERTTASTPDLNLDRARPVLKLAGAFDG